MLRFTRSGKTPGAAEARAAEAAAHSAVTKAIRDAYKAAAAAEAAEQRAIRDAYKAAEAAEKKARTEPAGGRKTRRGRKRGTRRK